MFGHLFIALFLHAIVEGSEMCDNRLGCFTNDPPWGGTLQRPAFNLPEPPEVVNTTFLLHTRENPTYFQVISAVYPSTIRISNFRTNRITRFIIHGYFADDDYLTIVEICKLLLLKEDINCIVVNWKDGSDKLYINAVQNIRIVGAELAYLLDYFEKNCGYSLSNVHIIGHSLGAHAGGEAGRRKRGLTRITGLDPAGPLFHNTPPEVRLDPSDATFVDVIHTNAGHLFFDFARGILEPCGHLDFYPNGGEIMPGCKKVYQSSKLCNISGAMREMESSKSARCSHKRSLLYYMESIHKPDGFLGYQCNTYKDFISGKCFPCQKEDCPMMGHYADYFADKTKEVHQVYYLNTGAFSPFACWRIHVYVKLTGTPQLRGNITLAFTGNNNVRRQYPVASGFFYPSHRYARFLDVDIPGNFIAVEFQWTKHPDWELTGYIRAQEVTIVYGENDQKSVFCGIKAVQSEVWQKLPLC